MKNAMRIMFLLLLLSPTWAAAEIKRSPSFGLTGSSCRGLDPRGERLECKQTVVNKMRQAFDEEVNALFETDQPVSKQTEKHLRDLIADYTAWQNNLCFFVASQYGERSMLAVESRLDCQTQWLLDRNNLMKRLGMALEGHANKEAYGE